MIKKITALQKAKALNDEYSFLARRIEDKDWRLLFAKSSFNLVLSIADSSRRDYTVFFEKTFRYLEEGVALLIILHEMKVINDREYIDFSMRLEEIGELMGWDN